jgi:nicotinamide-nucleotide amidase
VHAFNQNDPERLAAALSQRLKERGLLIATAESCTGGRVAAALTGIPNAAEFFAGGVVAYSAEAKVRLLDLHPSLIKDEGTVSERVASAMASAVCRELSADVGVAVTGVVGDATEGKPPGLVYAAVALNGEVLTRERRGDRGPEGNLDAAVELTLSACLEALSPDTDATGDRERRSADG